MALRTTPQTAEALAEARAVALLVGGYDGSGNFGDLAQLDAALGLLGELGSDLLVLPVIEQQFVGTHRMLAPEFVHSTEHVVYFDGGGDPDGEDLVPVRAPDGLGLAVSYLYGGGFLNPSWGERKLAMLRAVEGVFEGAGRVTRFASGLQADSAWVGGLDPGDFEMLRRFELWGGRDDSSTEVLAELGVRGPAVNTGDDALGILAAMDPAGAPSDDTVIEVNVHYAEHEWVTGHPDAVLEFDVGILAALSHLAGRQVRVRPLLAYLDPRIDDRPGQERFAAACAERGIEVAEPRVLRPANVLDLATEIGAADLTISSSYHVALTSLLLAIPTALLRDNDYYSQKALGLMGDFGLPPAFSPRSGDDPERAASELAPHLLDPEARAQTRADLETAAARMRRRRDETERRLLTLIAGQALAAAANGGRSPTATEAKLEEILDSRSWRITAPLRRLSRRRR